MIRAALKTFSFGMMVVCSGENTAKYGSFLYEVDGVHCLLGENEKPYFLDGYISRFSSKEDADTAIETMKTHCDGVTETTFFTTESGAISWAVPLNWSAPYQVWDTMGVRTDPVDL